MHKSSNDTKRIITSELTRLRRFAYSLTGNKADADDLVQSLVVKVLQKGMPDMENPVPWLLRVCKNIWLDEIRAKDVRLKAVLEEKIPQSKQETMEDIQDIHYSVDQVLSVMEQLSDEHRVLISLVVIEGFSYSEASDMLEIPKGTVMSRLSRARFRLIELLGEEI